MTIDYERFARVITRSIEIADEPNADAIVVAVFKETLADAAAAYLAAEAAVSTAMSAFAKENREALDALASLDTPYRVARAAVLAMLPGTKLPDTLKSQPTDTDQLKAIAQLLDLIDDHVGKEWADVLLAGEFGTKASQTTTELSESIAANKALSKARSDRAAAYGPTYEKYLRFKQVVRNVYGPGSKQYRRIHLRASPGASAPEAEETGT
ncbi:MAG: hypothetical protein IPM54_42830 [Polyangiaceae bacterium]|nr:hypothetical protein [Polyangiaceae bacterium]